MEIGIIFIMTKIATVQAVHSMIGTEAVGFLTVMRQTVGKKPIWMAMEVAVCQLTQTVHNLALVPFPFPSVLRTWSYTTSLEMEDVQLGTLL